MSARRCYHKVPYDECWTCGPNSEAREALWRLGSLERRVRELRNWATSRIKWCRREEQKFGGKSNIAIEAATERRALQAVLRILDDKEVPTS